MNATVRGIKSENRVVRIEKMRDGSLRAVNASGKTFVIPADDDVVQAFVAYTMIHADELRAVTA